MSFIYVEQEEKDPTLMNTKKSIILLCMMLSLTIIHGHQIDSISIKKILYHSYVCDQRCMWPYYYILQFDNYISDFEKFEVVSTPKLRFHTSPYSRREGEHDVYYIQLFKFVVNDFPYYVLAIDDCLDRGLFLRDEVWLRLSGFVESDIKLFFDYLMMNQELGFTMEKIRSMIVDWCAGDDMFGELDWECLIKGYLSNNPQGRCYRSWSKLFNSIVNHVSDRQIEDQEINSTFSTQYPMIGMFR